MNNAKELPRLTFENVLTAQTWIRQEIRRLIGENRTLNRDEDAEFIKVYYRATLGKGALATPRTNLPGINDISLDDLVTNHLSDPGLKHLRVGWADTDEWQKLAPAKVWALVLSRLNGDVFGAALQQAIALSPEHFTPEDRRRKGHD